MLYYTTTSTTDTIVHVESKEFPPHKLARIPMKTNNNPLAGATFTIPSALAELVLVAVLAGEPIVASLELEAVVEGPGTDAEPVTSAVPSPVPHSSTNLELKPSPRSKPPQ
jgi:hypothetical protein